MNHPHLLKRAAAVGTAAAIAVSASTMSFAAPLGTGQLALKNAPVADVVDVGWRGRRNTAIALGIIGGALLGGALAHRHHYPAPYPYAYAAPPPRQCLAWDPYRRRNVWVYC